MTQELLLTTYPALQVQALALVLNAAFTGHAGVETTGIGVGRGVGVAVGAT